MSAAQYSPCVQTIFTFIYNEDLFIISWLLLVLFLPENCYDYIDRLSINSYFKYIMRDFALLRDNAVPGKKHRPAQVFHKLDHLKLYGILWSEAKFSGDSHCIYWYM